ncbi:MAG: galactokinase [Treponema sp.]|jgi:galactokinase|nr:galactokinase [Treponema sp.]
MLDIGPIHHREYNLENDRSESVAVAEAPGRIHFLGEHGEPGAGLYLSAAIDRHIRVAVSMRRDNSLRFYAANLEERKRTTLINLKYKREDRWANYIKVVIRIFAALGYPVKGLNFTVMGDIPQQVGLASSAAIEVAAAIAMRGLFRAHLHERELLDKITEAHTFLFGTKTSAVDYLILLAARKDQFLLVDETNLSVQKIKSPFLHYKFLLTDSRVPRMEVNNELLRRRQDTKKGLELLSQKREGASFRDYATSDLVDYMGNLPEGIRRRSMHVVQEIRRVYNAEDALQRKDMPVLSRIIYHSHESLRDLYEVSCPEVDWLVKRAQEIEGIIGSRMTGQGFGGCTYAIMPGELAEEYKKRFEDYERIFGFHPVIYEVRLATGGRMVQN